MEPSLRVSPTALLKARVKVIKPFLPKNFRKFILEAYPRYNNAKNIKLVNNVVALRASDPFLTELLEQIAAHNKTFQINLEDAIKEKSETLF